MCWSFSRIVLNTRTRIHTHLIIDSSRFWTWFATGHMDYLIQKVESSQCQALTAIQSNPFHTRSLWILFLWTHVLCDDDEEEAPRGADAVEFIGSVCTSATYGPVVTVFTGRPTLSAFRVYFFYFTNIATRCRSKTKKEGVCLFCGTNV